MATPSFRINTGAVAKQAVNNFEQIGIVRRGSEGQLGFASADEIVSVLGGSNVDAAKRSFLELYASDPIFNSGMRKLVKSLNVLGTRSPKAGKEAVRELVSFDRQLREFQNSIVNQAYKKGSGTAVSRETNKIIEGLIQPNLDSQMKVAAGSAQFGQEITEALASARGKYAQMRTQMNPILELQSRLASGRADRRAPETFVNQFTSTTGKNLSVKDSIAAAIKELGSVDGNIKTLSENILDRDAVQAFIPTLRGSFVQFGVLAGGAGGGGALISGDIETAIKGFAVAGGIAVATSPRLAGKAALAAGSSSQTLAAATLKARQFISAIPFRDLNTFLTNPKLIGGLAQAIMRAPQEEQQAKQQIRAFADQQLQQGEQQ